MPQYSTKEVRMSRPRLTIGRRLALLGSIGLVVALMSNGASLVLGSRVNSLRGEENDYGLAQTLIRELDTRASELKVDGYKALLSDTPKELMADVTDDAGKVTVRLEAMEKLNLRADERAAVTKLR